MIDLNCDMGELADAALEAELMRHITAANIACGAHAGDESTIERTVRIALEWNVKIGAHPGYPDRANFGRVAMDLTPEQIERTVYEQVRRVSDIASRLGAKVTHVKPHGALYNVAAENGDIAAAIARGTARWSRETVLVGLARSVMLDVWADLGFATAAEGFADRRYEPDGTLRSRNLPGALILDPEEAAEQALRLARDGAVRTICVHGDTPGAPRIAEAVALRLKLRPAAPGRPTS